MCFTQHNTVVTYLLGLLGGWSPLVPVGPLWRCRWPVLPPLVPLISLESHLGGCKHSVSVPSVAIFESNHRHWVFNIMGYTCAGDWLTLVPPVQLTGLLLRHHQLLFEPQASGSSYSLGGIHCVCRIRIYIQNKGPDPAVLLIRNVYHGSRTRIFFHPGSRVIKIPGSRIRIRITEFKYFNLKNCF